MSQLAGRGQAAVQRLRQRMPWYTPANTIAERNVENLYKESAGFGVLSGLADTYVSVFALRLGATTAQVGWLTSLPALINIIWLLPAARIIEQQRRRIPLVLLSGILQRLGYLVMAIMPFFVVSGRVEALIVINALLTLPAAVINTAITSLIPDLTSAEQRGRVVRARWLILSAVATVSALIGGGILEWIPEPLNYQVVLGTGSAISLLGLYYLGRIEVPDAVIARRAAEPGRRYAWSRLRQTLASVTSHSDFAGFTVAAFVFHWGLNLPAALWSVLRVRDLGASDAWIGIIAVVVNASVIVGYLVWGRISAERGDRWLLIITSLGLVGFALFTALVPTIAWMIPTSILGGLSWAGCNLALFNVLLSVCPAKHRPTYVALYTTLLNITAFIAPMMGAVLSDWIGIRPAFVVSGGVRLLGVLLFLRLLR